MPRLTLAEMQDIQLEEMAGDIPIDFERMSLWSTEQLRNYFESGGSEEPPAPVSASGPPVLVAWPGVGLPKVHSLALLQHFLDCAKAGAGLVDSVNLSLAHHVEPVPSSWDEYVTYCVDTIEEVAKGRPLVFVGYSAGAVSAHSTALRLPGRVIKFVVLAMRANFLDVGRLVFGIDSAAELSALTAQQKMGAAARAWVPDLASLAELSEDKWPPDMKLMAAQVKIYELPFYVMYPEQARAYFGCDGAPKIDAPILVVASAGETAEGERPEKMAGWSEMTTSQTCEFVTLEGVPHAMLLFPDKKSGRCEAHERIIEHLAQMGRDSWLREAAAGQ